MDPKSGPKKLPYAEQRKIDEKDLVPQYTVSLFWLECSRSTSQSVTVALLYSALFQDNLSHLAGVPQEHVVERLARIAKAPKNAMQSGTDNTKAWILQFDNRQRWENDLMGWVST